MGTCASHPLGQVSTQGHSELYWSYLSKHLWQTKPPPRHVFLSKPQKGLSTAFFFQFKSLPTVAKAALGRADFQQYCTLFQNTGCVTLEWFVSHEERIWQQQSTNTHTSAEPKGVPDRPRSCANNAALQKQNKVLRKVAPKRPSPELNESVLVLLEDNVLRWVAHSRGCLRTGRSFSSSAFRERGK